MARWYTVCCHSKGAGVIQTSKWVCFSRDVWVYVMVTAINRKNVSQTIGWPCKMSRGNSKETTSRSTSFSSRFLIPVTSALSPTIFKNKAEGMPRHGRCNNKNSHAHIFSELNQGQVAVVIVAVRTSLLQASIELRECVVVDRTVLHRRRKKRMSGCQWCDS